MSEQTTPVEIVNEGFKGETLYLDVAVDDLHGRSIVLFAGANSVHIFEQEVEQVITALRQLKVHL